MKTWAEIWAAKGTASGVYDWCTVCGVRLGPDSMHIAIDNGRVTRHTYCCRKHRYVQVLIKTMVVAQEAGGRVHELEGEPRFVTQTRTDLEIESLAHAFRAGELAPGWE